ncbi:hypothetical protein [Lactococcus petauri]|uniref:hypothetical protein n=1 Tax=Lactococcus petauri TaxID=1940789 RepID=UPI00254CEC75|nr:hypothetical protein [Lactococcus petauri]
MNQEIDAQQLVTQLVSKIAQLELENAKLTVLVNSQAESNLKGEGDHGLRKANLE